MCTCLCHLIVSHMPRGNMREGPFHTNENRSHKTPSNENCMTYTLCYLISHKWYSRVSPLSLLEKHLDAHFVLFGTTESLRCRQWMAHVVPTLVCDPWDSEDKSISEHVEMTLKCAHACAISSCPTCLEAKCMGRNG